MFIAGLQTELAADAKQLRPNYKWPNALHQLVQMLHRKEEHMQALIACTLGMQPDLAPTADEIRKR